MDPITKNVFYESKVRGCNPGFVVTSEGVVMIDAPVDVEVGKKWRQEIEKHGRIRLLINTEHHMDHWVSNGVFPVDILSHESTREVMMTMDREFITARSKILYKDPYTLPPGYPLKRPNLTYAGHMILYFGSHTFHIIHTPGHTPGLSAVYIPEEKVVFTGDNVVGKTRTAYHDADPVQWVESLKTLEQLDVKHVLPGHGAPVGKEHLAVQSKIVQGWREGMEGAKAGGKAFDDDAKRKVDPYFDSRDTGINPSVILTATARRNQ